MTHRYTQNSFYSDKTKKQEVTIECLVCMQLLNYSLYIVCCHMSKVFGLKVYAHSYLINHILCFVNQIESTLKNVNRTQSSKL
jgi:hypothetical protein